MKKIISIMTVSRTSAIAFKDIYKSVFKDLVEIYLYSSDLNGFENMIESDLYFLGATSSKVFDDALMHIPEKSQIVMCNLTFTKKSLEKIKLIPKSSKVLLVNLSQSMALESISTLQRLGVNDIELYPFDNKKPNEYDLINFDYVLTPNETSYVPKKYKDDIINLGYRVITQEVLWESMLKLEMEEISNTIAYKEYVDKLAEKNYGIDNLNMQISSKIANFTTLIDALDVGVIGIDVDNTIFAFNNSAQKILGEKKENIIGKQTTTALPYLPLDVHRDPMLKTDSKLLTIKNNSLSLSIAPILNDDIFNGYFALLNRFNEQEEKQHKLRMQLIDRGHTAKYNFDDIIGEDLSILKVKNIANKIASSSSSVLIYGENGTGKELFAHAIHNASPRKDKPFVAINCAAMPDNLFESELFGYEEGSFTGAKKGGKLGLFEYAHQGTLFLDEIEGMSIALQIKLLRALQEKEIIRVGGDRVIKVDVRIIAASNEKIKKLIDEGKFRKDLYYRINSTLLEIPALRERDKDIDLITEFVMKRNGYGFSMDSQVRKILNSYAWDGNVRQLINTLEYFSCLEKDLITIEELPSYLLEDLQLLSSNFDKNVDIGKKGLFILNALNNDGNIGREKLSAISQESDTPLSIQQVRTVLRKMEEQGLVEILKGRNGTKITQEGHNWLKFANQL